MTIECRSVFFWKYEEKMKGLLLCSHPLHVHTGEAVMGRESVPVSVLGLDTCKPMVCMGEWSDLSLPAMNRASAIRESQLPESVQKWNSYIIRPIACPIQLNQNQQASLSQYISSFKKIFVTSLCPSHLSSSMHPRTRCLCATHSYLDAGDIEEEAAHQHYVIRQWLIFMFGAYTQFSNAVWSLLGVLRLPSSH